MQYKFLPSHTVWLPAEPTPDTVTSETILNFSEIVLPRLAAVGGVQAFAAYLKEKKLIHDVNYTSDDELKMLDQLQNQLIADGYPKDVVNMFNVFQLESFNDVLQQFAKEEEDIQYRNSTNWIPLDKKQYKIRLRERATSSDLRCFGFDHLNSSKNKLKKTGYIRWLPSLPRTADGNGSIDVGTFMFFVSLLTLLYFIIYYDLK